MKLIFFSEHWKFNADSKKAKGKQKKNEAKDLLFFRSFDSYR